MPIMSGVASATSKSVQPSCTFAARSSAPDVVGAGLLGLARGVALGEDGDGLRAAGAVGQHERAAQLLVGVAHVEAEPEVRLDGLVELGRLERLEQADASTGW